MREFEEYLERRGAKYFVTFTVLSYVLGTIIFNIYLNSINIAEFDLLKLRYMFVGFTFILLTAIFPLLYWGIKKILGKKTADETEKAPKKKNTLWTELLVVVLLIPWTVVYSTKIFPEIPAGFGGAKPETVRLIGDPETIKELNELIAFETGVDVETLPFQYATEKSKLAIGANVKILDRNTDRYVLILTKDLYLSSTSNVAKELLESGEVKSFESSNSQEFFQAKPIYFSSDNIRGTTTTLFEPPKITTSDDLKVVAQVVSDNPEKAKAVETVIAKDLPGSATKIVEAVRKKTEENNQENASNQKDIDTLLAETVDQKFLGFRADMFHLAGQLYDKERAGEKSINGRKDLAQAITDRFQTDFPTEWARFSGDENYLIAGQDQKDYFQTIQSVFRGADSAEIIMDRLNALEVIVVDEFTPVIAEAKVLFESSSTENNEYNRKFMSEVLVRHFNQKARKYSAFWNDPKYLYSGVHDERYFENLRNFFETADSWESVKTLLDGYHSALTTPAENSSESQENPASSESETGSAETSSEISGGGEEASSGSSEAPQESQETPPAEEAESSESQENSSGEGAGQSSEEPDSGSSEPPAETTEEQNTTP